MPKITLKRVTATDGTVTPLYPTTTLDQIISEGTGSGGANESLSDYLDSTFIPLSEKGANSGVATLDSTGKLNEAQLPASVVGGMKFYGTVDLSSGTSSSPVELSSVFGSLLTYSTFDDAEYDRGSYVVVTDGGFVKDSSGTQNSVAYHRFDIGDSSGSAPGNTYGEELDTTSPYEVEKGDWIVFYKRTVPTGGVKYYLYTIINNTYADANDSVKGVVKLLDATNAGQYNSSTNTGGLVNGANEVVTENFLFDNIASGEMNGGASGANDVLNKIASSNHIHDGRYYTETEIASFFSGGTSITGYNNDNWDNAYSGEITGLSYSNGTITLARDSGSEADLTASLSGSVNFGSGSVITADRFELRSDLDGTAEIPSWSLVEYDNQISAQAFTGSQTNRYPLVHTDNIVAKATAADFEKIFYLASTDTNSDQTVGSIIIQED